MLTIRAIGIHGEESLFQAGVVIRGEDANNTNGNNWQLEFYDDDRKTHEPIYFGHVYVMNDAGKTVAAYNLGGWKTFVAQHEAERKTPVEVEELIKG